MYHPEQEQSATAQPHIPIRRRGREPPRPTTALDSAGAESGGDDARGWQLHHSSSGLPFYFNCATGESVWARPSLGNPSGTSVGDVGDGTNANDTLKRTSDRNTHTSSSSSGGSSSSGSGSGSSSSSGTSLASSSSTGERKGSDGSGILTSNSSETLTASSASYASSGDSSRSSNGDRSLRVSSESSYTSSSSDDSWTGSMETRFRQMVVSEQGRKMLAGEVEALTARQAKRAQQEFTRGTKTQRRDMKRRRRTRISSYARRQQFADDEEDVEMSLLAVETTDSDRDSNSSSSSDTDTAGSSFSLDLSSGSDGGSDLSLLTSDAVLERLEKVEKGLLFARSSALSVFRASCGFARQASVVVWAAVLRGTTRARGRFFSGRLRSDPSSSFSPAA